MPELDLLCAVIEKAVEDARIVPEECKTKKLRNEAKDKKDKAIKWLKSKKQSFMSFEWYCNLADFSPNAIRKKLSI